MTPIFAALFLVIWHTTMPKDLTLKKIEPLEWVVLVFAVGGTLAMFVAFAEDRTLVSLSGFLLALAGVITVIHSFRKRG